MQIRKKRKRELLFVRQLHTRPTKHKQALQVFDKVSEKARRSAENEKWRGKKVARRDSPMQAGKKDLRKRKTRKITAYADDRFARWLSLEGRETERLRILCSRGDKGSFDC